MGNLLKKLIKQQNDAVILSGTVPIFPGQKEIQIILPHEMPDDNYFISVEPHHQTSHWIINKLSHGFTIGIGTIPSGYNSLLSWIAIKA